MAQIYGTQAFQNTVLVAVVINTVLLAVDHHGVEEVWGGRLSFGLAIANYVLTACVRAQALFRLSTSQLSLRASRDS